jgi:CubicO group peptidase (beta-lactamase class C family)
MQSVTKSVTSALIGIAIGRGEISGVEIPVIDYLEGYELGEINDWKRSMTLEDLLTMRAGIQWDESTVPYTDPANSCAAMEGSEDWVQYVVDQPMAHEPGTVFRYNSGASHLLSLIIKKSTGKYVDEYAEDHLFGPLGIKNHYWKKTPKGFPDTEGGLYLLPRDLARVGYLYLMDGVWDGTRILLEGWVRDSVELHTRNADGGFGYGYQWWLTPWGNGQSSFAYTGWGYGGQFLFVVPEHDLVAVFTGWNIYDTPSLNPHYALSSVIDAVKTP